jgi:hypothetical protein
MPIRICPFIGVTGLAAVAYNWASAVKRHLSSRVALVLAGVVVVAVTAGGLLWALDQGGGSGRSSVESTAPYRVHNGIHVYTFKQAVSAGVSPSLQSQLLESGLPLCGTQGPTSAKARAALKKVIARNDGDTCMADPRETTTATGSDQAFFALNAVSAGNDRLRYTDSAGWSIVYPRRFHAVAYTNSNPGIQSTEGASFANFKPIPIPGDPTYDSSPQIPATGVLFQLTASSGGLGGGLLGVPQGGKEARFPLGLARSVSTRSTGDSVQSGDLTFVPAMKEAS